MPTAYVPASGSSTPSLVRDLPEEPVGHLHEHARTVAGVGLAADGATVVEVAQRGEAVGDDLVARDAGQGRDHGDTAGVVLVLRVVQALWLRERGRK